MIEGVLWVLFGLIVLYVVAALIIRFATVDTGYYDGPKNLKEPPTIAIVTGTTHGIGTETVQEFAADGAHVIMVDHSDERSAAVGEEIRKKTGNENIQSVHCDLSDLQSVKECSLKLLRICADIRQSSPGAKWRVILCNNAGLSSRTVCASAQGYEIQYAVNFLGHFALTANLLPLLLDPSLEECRVVVVSSMSHQMVKSFEFDTLRADQIDPRTYRRRRPAVGYPRSKLADLYLTHELVRRFDGFENNKMSVYSVHPGHVITDIHRRMPLPFFILGAPLLYLSRKTSLQGAQTTIACALSDRSDLKNGGYYADRKLSTCSALAQDKEVSSRLWATATDQARGFLTEDALAILDKVKDL